MKSGLTATQVDLLHALIKADRHYRSCEAQGNPLHPDDRGVDVTSYKDSTIRALVDARLAETIGMGRQTWMYLVKYRATYPIDEDNK